jgi:hypothetical protein
MRYEVLMELKITVFSDMPCGLADMYQQVEEPAASIFTVKMKAPGSTEMLLRI